MKLLRNLAKFHQLATYSTGPSSFQPRLAQYLARLTAESTSNPSRLRLGHLSRRRDEILQRLEADLAVENDDRKDAEMSALLHSLRSDNLAELNDVETKILANLAPPSAQDGGGVMLEVSSGAGGLEAMLFSREIFGLYENYARWRQWQFEVVDIQEESGLGGIRNVTVSITGKDVYKRLKFEGGVHRVQRVPAKTESSGRIHTSTTSVAILPQPTDISVVLKWSDVRVETYRSGSAGGQHANKTDSAVRLVHLPTGVVVENQTDRSQLINRRLATRRLAAILSELQVAKEAKIDSQRRKLQVGRKDRAEKIRTYNFPQDRVSDHRLKINFAGVKDIMAGGEKFDEILDCLQRFHQDELIEEMLVASESDDRQN